MTSLLMMVAVLGPRECTSCCHTFIMLDDGRAAILLEKVVGCMPASECIVLCTICPRVEQNIYEHRQVAAAAKNNGHGHQKQNMIYSLEFIRFRKILNFIMMMG